jgi:hypothetical protein
MDAITLLTVLFAAISLYVAFRAYLAQKDQDALLGLELAQIETGKTGSPLLQTLANEVAKGVQRSGRPASIGSKNEAMYSKDKISTKMREKAHSTMCLM